LVNSWPPMHARPISRQHKCRGKCPNALLGPGGTHKAFLVIVYQSHVLGAHWRQPPATPPRHHAHKHAPTASDALPKVHVDVWCSPIRGPLLCRITIVANFDT